MYICFLVCSTVLSLCSLMPSLCLLFFFVFFFFFFNDTATTEIYTLSLRRSSDLRRGSNRPACCDPHVDRAAPLALRRRSEEHTSELQSHHDLVCRLLHEKKTKRTNNNKSQNNTQMHKVREKTMN